ncbi:hypothetical protein H6P81_005296 [Aristolochia fimbriata]|uniref:Uncharacterized protein n=1 Tax=Aristolochia fimbriata TaxID=158543 RepID=A0AAV7EU61_ARIFI|nr:hypothetical protein H6P81_005296 [Aristolochia fimbriata]
MGSREMEELVSVSIAPVRTKAAKEVGEDGNRVEEEGDGGEFSTPKSEEHRIRPILVCPPAPRKPRPVKRKPVSPPAGGFFLVPHDLGSVFVRHYPSSKKIKAV